ncbi:MAG: ATP-dependent zinc protease [SAR324 cluster bacterium]|nr:ATP-dependent zinc protease [SAR324 cluster bacterium]
MREKKIIGRLEKVNFPDWEIFGLEAKIDTGAYTSSLHCSDIDIVLREGKEWVRFSILDSSHPYFQNTHLFSPLLKEKKVKSSSGETEHRVFIKSRIYIFGKSYLTDLSLTNRSEMKYPVLLGRKILRNRFLVDVSKKFLSNQYEGDES